jgi:TIR domain
MFLQLVESLQYGKTSLNFSGNIYLPSARYFPGELHVENKPNLRVAARFFGDSDWINFTELKGSTRIFIYSETELDAEQSAELKTVARKNGHDLQFRSVTHAARRSQFEKPLAFISHDSRDKQIARAIALQLQKWMCPVWYDEFSLKVGDKLRDSIEAGLKTCKKCVLVLSPNFFANAGWTKREFDSIFTREILEQARLVLPVWVGVGKEEVYDYSPSLLDVKGILWDLGEEEVCRQLPQTIMGA